MAFDDPIVWILIVAVVIFLFGAGKIPSLARSIGQARREFDRGFRGEPSGATTTAQVTAGTSTPITSSSAEAASVDPLLQAAEREGIETKGKTREQVASELSWKLNKK